MIRAAVLAVCFLGAVMAPAGADPAKPQDRAAIAACLKHVGERIAAQTGAPAPKPEEPVGSIDPASCVGIVASACQRQPGFGSTPGMIDCNHRELAVWDERLNRFYRIIVKGGGNTAKAVQRAERAWLALRDAKCDLPSILEEGGSIVGPLESACLYEETARQALWLEQIAQW
jgi:uncharacterized protein YecT (DUF1311 family)